MVKTCIPGDDVTITGIIKVSQIFFIFIKLIQIYYLSQVRDLLNNHGKNKQNTVFNLYLDAVSIFSNSKENTVGDIPSKGITFSNNDYNLINVSIRNIQG